MGKANNKKKPRPEVDDIWGVEGKTYQPPRTVIKITPNEVVSMSGTLRFIHTHAQWNAWAKTKRLLFRKGEGNQLQHTIIELITKVYSPGRSTIVRELSDSIPCFRCRVWRDCKYALLPENYGETPESTCVAAQKQEVPTTKKPSHKDDHITSSYDHPKPEPDDIPTACAGCGLECCSCTFHSDYQP